MKKIVIERTSIMHRKTSIEIKYKNLERILNKIKTDKGEIKSDEKKDNDLENDEGHKKFDFNVKSNLEQELEKEQKENKLSEVEEKTMENKVNEQQLNEEKMTENNKLNNSKQKRTKKSQEDTIESEGESVNLEELTYQDLEIKKRLHLKALGKVSNMEGLEIAILIRYQESKETPNKIDKEREREKRVKQ